MLEIHLPGNGGMVPLPGRFLSSLFVRCRGRAVLIDCGEGTQIALRAAGLSLAKIDAICLTHFHADHVAGLPGLLLSIGNTGREAPLTIIGPRHVREIVGCLLVIAPQLPYEIDFIELPEAGGEICSFGELTLSAQPVEHWIPCYAYRLDLRRQGKFLPEKAHALGIPVESWKTLQTGGEVVHNGRTIRPGDVLGKSRRGLSVCYATDLRPSDALADFARDVDLFVCEGMYGDPALLQKALEHRHCLFTEAALMAKRAGARELWLTHFSPSMTTPEEYLHHAADIFPNTRLDRRSVVLSFPEEL